MPWLPLDFFWIVSGVLCGDDGGVFAVVVVLSFLLEMCQNKGVPKAPHKSFGMLGPFEGMPDYSFCEFLKILFQKSER